MKKLFLLIGLLITNGLSATSALYLHHERSTQANTEADCQNREMCLDKINLAPIGRFNDGTLWHGVTQEKPNVNLTGTLNVTGATVLANNLTLSLFATGRIPYTTTAGLLTSGTGLTYNGSAFSVTGAGAISGDFAIATNKFNVTAATGNASSAGNYALAGRLNINGATDNSNYTINGFQTNAAFCRSGGTGGNIQSFGVGVPGGSNLEYAGLSHDGAANVDLGVYQTGTGSYRPLRILNGGSTAITVATNQAVTLAGTLAVTGASTLSGAVTHGAGFIDKTTSLTSNTTLTTAHSVIFADASGGSFTITLPAVSGNTGLTYTIYKTDVSAAATGGGNTVTIDGNGSETIGGALTQILASNTGTGIIKIICNGSSWKIQELYEEGTFTLTLTGCTTSPTATAYWIRNGNLVTVNKPDELSATSNTTSLSVTGIPVALRPSTRSTTSTIGAIYDNTLEYTGIIQVGAVAGSFEPYFKTSLSSAHSGIYTSSGTKGLSSFNITYILK